MGLSPINKTIYASIAVGSSFIARMLILRGYGENMLVESR